MGSLEVLSPDGQDFVELDGDKLTIGRSDTNDLVVKEDSSLSRYHAVLEHFGTGWYIQDLDSPNGVMVNGLPSMDGARSATTTRSSSAVRRSRSGITSALPTRRRCRSGRARSSR